MAAAATSKAMQDMRLAFQAAILAGTDSAAPHVYADWLEDNGLVRDARHVRDMITRGKLEQLAFNIRVNLISKADGLLKSQTAFKAGWYDTLSSYSGEYGLTKTYGDGFATAVAGGYVPTLSRSKKLQASLGAYLEALGVPVYWIK
jgi:uncharacterized protein (TIGR02996 family)